MTTGDLSTLLVWAAATAFTVALVAYTIDMARIAERSQRGAAAPELVGAAVASDGAPAASSSVPRGPVSAVAGSADEAAAGRSVRAEGIARSTHWLGVVLLFGGIVLRGIAAGRWPTANMYEFTLVGVFVATLVLAIVQRRRAIPFISVVVLGLAVLFLATALLKFYVQAEAVQPALQSYWLILHVGVAITATGVFTVAFAASVLQVIRDARENGRSHLAARGGSLAGWAVTGPRFAWLEQVPDARRLEAMAFRLNAVGFVLWTFTLIAGAIWAEHAWGRYWGWDPKEIGTFVAWVVYAAYLHARTTRGWSGRRAAYFVFVGYAVVLANFTVVNLVVTGKHSYSGL
ncbi:c-type cytochrome biogenesis protein CcsB [Cellulomonas sp. HZM]|uniref:c-type cytochrome biogenesis protein CcsB n=1 Tax=Cellulomonas sp. HZM TaxID=1454010 RepID=UPI0004938D3B|nr:c-type cytochrome biogenesis protein CcsB [Cellulomonas sp. HZM]